MNSPSRIATLSRNLGVVAIVLFALGPIAIKLGVLSSFLGFRVFGLGFLLGFVTLLLGLLGIGLTRRTPGRERALAGTVLGLVIFLTVLISAGGAGSLPAINDITTDPDDPPVFVAALRAPANLGRDLSYPPEFAEIQRGAYEDLVTFSLDAPPTDALSRAQVAAEDLGWEIVAVDPDAGMLEAIDVSGIFEFVDDIVVRVRASGAGSEMDVRSKSRDGKGDMGANAARIRALRDRLTD